MKTIIALLALVVFIGHISLAQKKYLYSTKIEPCNCWLKADSGLKTTCGYLMVPESRTKPNGKTIKLPFAYVHSNNPDKHKDAVLYTAGGPGASSLQGVRIHYRMLMKDRDYIAFEQRGTTFAQPFLSCDGIGDGIKQAYRKNLPVDSMIIDGIKNCHKNLLAHGIDLDAYNTDENAADIEDLRRTLNIDSLNLMGISYSGGLMMAVLKKYPRHIRSLILDSPLPEFVNIDEDELINFNEALNNVFINCDADSTDKGKYLNLKQRFHDYFLSIEGKVFYINYLEKGSPDSIKVKYGRNELLNILHNYMEDYYKIKKVPELLVDLIHGYHQPYIKAYLDNVFNSHGGESAMRISVYCSDKMAYADKDIIDQQEKIQPFMAGFHVNDVYRPMCSCWPVKPIAAETKKPFYSNIPALLSAGGMDDACRPIYNDMIHHYFPNSQRLLFVDRQHGPLFNSYEGDAFIGRFLDNPYKKITSDKKDIIAY